MVFIIKKTRIKNGLTQSQLGEMCGVKQPIIARIENGTTTPNTSTVLKVLAALGKTLYIGDINDGVVRQTGNV